MRCAVPLIVTPGSLSYGSAGRHGSVLGAMLPSAGSMPTGVGQSALVLLEPFVADRRVGGKRDAIQVHDCPIDDKLDGSCVVRQLFGSPGSAREVGNARLVRLAEWRTVND